MNTSDVNKSGFPTIDRPWLQFYRNEINDLHLEKCSIYELLRSRNAVYQDNTAIQYFGNRISFYEMFEMVEKCTKSLSAIGITRGTCINLLTAGVPEAVYLVLACSKIGAIANFINPLLEETEKVDRINDTKSKWLFVLDEMLPYVENIISNICVENIVIIPITESFPPSLKVLSTLKKKDHKILHFIKWKTFMKYGASQLSISDNYRENEPVLMVYSSGTTGTAKGIVHTNDSVNATIQDSLSSGLYLERGFTFLQIIPIWFSTGIIQSILLPLFCGVIVIMEPRFDNKVFVKDMIKHKPTMTIAATSMWMAALNDTEFDRVDLTNLLYPFTGGEKVTPNIERQLNEFFESHGCREHLIKGYGMCELGGKVTDTIVANKEGSVGIPMSHIIVGIFDPITNEELCYGEHGEIRVDSPAHMKEYYHNDAATKEYFWVDSKGKVWGCTGDIGYLDMDGLLYVLGRSTDSYLSTNGKLVYLFDIEEEIINDEAVSECKVVYTVVNNTNALVAHVVINSSNLIDEKSVFSRITSMLEKKLPSYMVPQYYKSHNSMPINKNGKRDVISLKNDVNDLTKAFQQSDAV